MLPSRHVILYGRHRMWRIWSENFLCKPQHDKEKTFIRETTTCQFGLLRRRRCQSCTARTQFFTLLIDSVLYDIYVFLQKQVFSTPFARSYNSIQGQGHVQLEIPQRYPSGFIPSFAQLATVQPPFDLILASVYKQKKYILMLYELFFSQHIN